MEENQKLKKFARKQIPIPNCIFLWIFTKIFKIEKALNFKKLKKRVLVRGFIPSSEILERLGSLFREKKRKQAQIAVFEKEKEKMQEKGPEDNPLFNLFKAEYEIKNG